MERKFEELLRIFLFNRLISTDEFSGITNWDKIDEYYENLEERNPEVKKITMNIEDFIYDFIEEELENDLITKYFDNKDVSNLINKLRPIFLEDVNKKAFQKINGIDESLNKIKRFEEFEVLNEKIDLYKIDINELTDTREGFDLFIKLVKAEGFDVRQTTTHGYQFDYIGDDKVDLFNIWKEKYHIIIESDRVSNREHPDYGKSYHTFSLFRDPTKFYDTSDIVKKLNK